MAKIAPQWRKKGNSETAHEKILWSTFITWHLHLHIYLADAICCCRHQLDGITIILKMKNKKMIMMMFFSSFVSSFGSVSSFHRLSVLRITDLKSLRWFSIYDYYFFFNRFLVLNSGLPAQFEYASIAICYPIKNHKLIKTKCLTESNSIWLWSPQGWNNNNNKRKQ